MLHHLDEKSARKAINEMVRVCRSRGNLVILDAVLPERKWLRPLAYFIRYLDKGSYMRTQSQIEKLLPDMSRWRIRKYTYTATGLEMIQCIYSFPEKQ
jgi:ubiquinone/menaquinone biosynthesis C-methylase UbiE